MTYDIFTFENSTAIDMLNNFYFDIKIIIISPKARKLVIEHYIQYYGRLSIKKY